MILTKQQRQDVRIIELFKRTQQALIRNARPYLTAILKTNPSQSIDKLIFEVDNDLKNNQFEYQFILKKSQENYQKQPLVIQQTLHQTCPHLYY